MKGELAFLANSKKSSAAFNSRPTVLDRSIIGHPLKGFSAPCRGRKEAAMACLVLFCLGVARRPRGRGTVPDRQDHLPSGLQPVWYFRARRRRWQRVSTSREARPVFATSKGFIGVD